MIKERKTGLAQTKDALYANPRPVPFRRRAKGFRRPDQQSIKRDRILLLRLDARVVDGIEESFDKLRVEAAFLSFCHYIG